MIDLSLNKIDMDQAERILLQTAEIDSSCSVILHGTYGIGKSSLAKQVANKLDVLPENFITICPSTTSLLTLALPYKDVENNIPYSDLAMSKLLPKKGPAVILVDEINTADIATQPMLYQLLLDKKIGLSYKCPPNTLVFAACNLDEDKSATRPMANALRSRMDHFLLEPTFEDCQKWWIKNDVLGEVISFAKSHPGSIIPQRGAGFNNRDSEHKDPTGGCRPRSLTRLSNRIRRGIDPRDEEVVFRGTIGHEYGSLFHTFVTTYRRQIDLDSIFRDPKGANIPSLTEPDLLYNVTVALGTNVDSEPKLKAAIDYLNRAEFPLVKLMVTFARHKTPKIQDCKVFRDFILDNQNSLLF